MKTEAHILRMAREKRSFRLSDAVLAGVDPEAIRRLAREGRLRRVGRDVYSLPLLDAASPQTLAEVARRAPKGIVCLLSALRFHGLARVRPTEVWLALDRRLGIPLIDVVPVRFVRTSGPSLADGIEEHEIEQVRVRVTTPARTVVDCFKFRNKIGLDVTLAALKDYRRVKKGSPDEIWRLAELLRMSNVIRPYWAWLL